MELNDNTIDYLLGEEGFLYDPNLKGELVKRFEL